MAYDAERGRREEGVDGDDGGGGGSDGLPIRSIYFGWCVVGGRGRKERWLVSVGFSL